jgi:hypothetical protein
MPEKIIHVSSAQRDLRVHPTSSRYTVALPGDGRYKRSVCGVDLVGATFPKTQPVFTDGNRYIDISTANSADVHTIEIPVGNYGVGDLLAYINEKYVDIVYCRIVVTTGKFVIGSATSEDPIRLLFGTGPNRHRSAHTTLGFPSVDSDWALEHFGVMHVNLDSSACVDVIIEELPTACHQETHAGPILARVPLDNSNFTVKVWENDHFTSNQFYPMYLPKMTIRLRNANGQTYDTFGFDHVLVFRIRFVAEAEKEGFTPRTAPEYILLDGDPPPVGTFAPPSKPKKKYVRNACIGMGVLGTSYFAATRLGPRT